MNGEKTHPMGQHFICHWSGICKNLNICCGSIFRNICTKPDIFNRCHTKTTERVGVCNMGWCKTKCDCMSTRALDGFEYSFHWITVLSSGHHVVQFLDTLPGPCGNNRYFCLFRLKRRDGYNESSREASSYLFLQ